MKRISYALILVVLLIVGCSPARLSLNYDNFNNPLSVKLLFSSDVDDSTRAVISSETDSFIKIYNQRGQAIQLVRNDDAKANFMSVNILDVKYVSSGTQAVSTVVTIAGISTLIYTLANAAKTGFYIGWYWLPQYGLEAKFKLSDDIEKTAVTSIRQNGSFHGFSNEAEQREGLASDYRYLLENAVEELEDR